MRRMTRSRGRSLPRPTWRLRLSSGPPSAALAARLRSSATSERFSLALAAKALEAVSTALLSFLMEWLPPIRGKWPRTLLRLGSMGEVQRKQDYFPHCRPGFAHRRHFPRTGGRPYGGSALSDSGSCGLFHHQVQFCNHRLAHGEFLHLPGDGSGKAFH